MNHDELRENHEYAQRLYNGEEQYRAWTFRVGGVGAGIAVSAAHAQMLCGWAFDRGLEQAAREGALLWSLERFDELKCGAEEQAARFLARALDAEREEREQRAEVERLRASLHVARSMLAKAIEEADRARAGE